MSEQCIICTKYLMNAINNESYAVMLEDMIETMTYHVYGTMNYVKPIVHTFLYRFFQFKKVLDRDC